MSSIEGVRERRRRPTYIAHKALLLLALPARLQRVLVNAATLSLCLFSVKGTL